MAMRDMAPLGDQLRGYRRALGLTQEGLAERAGLSERAVREIERGSRHTPRSDTLQLLADALKLAGVQREAFEAAAGRAGRPLLRLHRSERVHPTNLPDEPTPFIGREKEIAALLQLLQRPKLRLVTLTGPGGSGKTRLALEVAAARTPAFADGVFLVSLAPLTESTLVASAIAEMLEIKDTGEQSLIDTLKDKQLLLVLDNFEHLPGAAPLVGDLVRSCPSVQILVTSREILHLSAEREFPVPPLRVPDLNQVHDPQTISRYDAVAFFGDRAQAARPDFVLTEDNASSVAAICHRLDGLPLAIELAAARIRQFPPQALLGRLSHGLDLLTGGAHDRPTRQQTLRSTIDWSYSLLSSEEQTLFARLSVFVGGCTLDAAECVCKAERDPAIAVLDGVASLVEKSLVRQEGEAESRFGMLQTIREYAVEKLEERGDAGEVRRRYALYFLNLAELCADEGTGPAQRAAWKQLQSERDNLSAAFGWASEYRELEIGLRLAVASSALYDIFGPLSDAQMWLEKLLASEDSRGAVSPQLRAQALQLASTFTWFQEGNADRSRALAMESLALLRELRDDRELAGSLYTVGWLLREQGNYAGATELLTEGLSLSRGLEDRLNTAFALIGLGDVGRETGNAQRVIEPCEESLQLFRELGNQAYVGYSLHNLGWAAWMLGDLSRARLLHEEALKMFFDIGAEKNVPEIFQSLALVVGEQGHVRTAESLLVESLTLPPTWDIPSAESATGLERMAELALVYEQAERAARLFGAAHAFRLRISKPIWPVNRPLHERDLTQVREALGEEQFGRSWEEGRAMTVEQAIDYALEGVELP